MRSNEFIKEAGRNGSMDDFGQPINPIPTDAEYAARQAQGAKTGAAIKDFFSGTPKELKPAPASSRMKKSFEKQWTRQANMV
jgi:hypothetical protein